MMEGDMSSSESRNPWLYKSLYSSDGNVVYPTLEAAIDFIISLIQQTVKVDHCRGKALTLDIPATISGHL